MTLSGANLVQLVFAFHAAFFALFVLGREQRQRALPALLLILAGHISATLIEETTGARFQITHAFGLTYGPLLYFLVREMIFVGVFPRVRDLWHFAPALAVIPLAPTSMVNRMAALTSLVVYLVSSFRLLLRHRRAVRESRSDAELLNLRWLGQIMAAFAVLGAVDAARILLVSRLPATVNRVSYALVLVVAFGLINGLILRAMRYPTLFAGFEPEDLEAKPKAPVEPADRERFERLVARVAEDEIYREPRITLVEVAGRLNMDPQELSRLVNDVSQSNFSDLVNQMRIDEVKREIERQPEASLLTLALDAGFNSKSSFNLTFKKREGVTPSAYRRQIEDNPV